LHNYYEVSHGNQTLKPLQRARRGWTAVEVLVWRAEQTLATPQRPGDGATLRLSGQLASRSRESARDRTEQLLREVSWKSSTDALNHRRGLLDHFGDDALHVFAEATSTSRNVEVTAPNLGDPVVLSFAAESHQRREVVVTVAFQGVGMPPVICTQLMACGWLDSVT
jgi:hypothetical protein